MEKKNVLIFAGISIVLIFSLINFVYAENEKCPELSNYVEHTYFIYSEKENNFVDFDISASNQSIPVYIYIDKPFIQQMFVINLTQKDANGKYFDHVKLNLKDTTVAEIYLQNPGIHTLLITTDPHYYQDNIYDLCMPEPPSIGIWDDIFKNNETLIKFLNSELNINLAKDAKIEKKESENNEIINIRDNENIIAIEFNKKENVITLKLIGGETKKYLLKEENGKLNIYNYPCNALPHPCSKSDRILKHIKVISTDKHDYGIIYKLKGLNDVNENISYFEKQITLENFTEEYKWNLFLLSNSSAVNNEYVKKLLENATTTEKVFTSAVVVEGIVYDNDANPVKDAEVGVYLVGIEPYVIHIFTITDNEGKFKIYYKPSGKYIYRLPKIYMYDPNTHLGYLYSGLADSVDMRAPPKKYPESKTKPFPVTETLILGLLIGSILVLFGTGYLNKIINAITGKKKEEHKSTH